MHLIATLAHELAAHESQVEAAVALLDGGATVPFIARYRKEATGGLDDTQLRLLEERLGYLRELEARRGVILASIREQGSLSAELETALLAADSKTRLEDLYLPYKPKRRTKAQIAREAGLAPLAQGLRGDPLQTPETVAAGFIDAGRGVPRCQSGSRWGAADSHGGVRRERRIIGEPARVPLGKRRAAFAGGRGQG
jgi:uncharacterized protein